MCAPIERDEVTVDELLSCIDQRAVFHHIDFTLYMPSDYGKDETI